MFNLLKNLFNKSAFKKANGHKRVLVVDDSEVDRKLLERILLKEGYQVLMAENGQKGFTISFL